MPTVPVVIEALNPPSFSAGSVGWYGEIGYGGRDFGPPSSPSCFGMEGPYDAGSFGVSAYWYVPNSGGTSIDFSDISFSVSTPPISGLPPFNRSILGTITYPDVAGGTPQMLPRLAYRGSGGEVTHRINSTLTHTLQIQTAPFGSLSWTQMVGHDISVIGDTVYYTMEFKALRVFVDGTLYHDGADRAQLRVGGIDYDFTLTYSDLGDSTAYTTLTYADGSTHPVTTEHRVYSGTVEFPLAAQDVSVRVGNNYGEWLPWNPLKFKPDGSFTATIEDDELAVDASGVYFVGSTPRTGDGFSYTPGGDTDEPVATFDVSSAGYSDDDAVTVTLTATSQYGCQSLLTDDVTVVESNHISATSDPDGVGYVAKKEGSDLVTKQYTDGYASEVLKATLPNHDSPTLYQIPGSTRFYLSARNKDTGSFTLYYSDDHCETFEVLS